MILKKNMVLLVVFLGVFSCDTTNDNSGNSGNARQDSINTHPADGNNQGDKGNKEVTPQLSSDFKIPEVDQGEKAKLLESIKNNPTAKGLEGFNDKIISEVMASVVVDKDMVSLENFIDALSSVLRKEERKIQGLADDASALITIKFPQSQLALIAAIVTKNEKAYDMLRLKYHPDRYTNQNNPVIAAVLANSPFIDRVLNDYPYAISLGNPPALCIAIKEGLVSLYDKLYADNLKCDGMDPIRYAALHGVKDWVPKRKGK